LDALQTHEGSVRSVTVIEFLKSTINKLISEILKKLPKKTFFLLTRGRNVARMVAQKPLKKNHLDTRGHSVRAL
jgi:hypothetical protein